MAQYTTTQDVLAQLRWVEDTTVVYKGQGLVHVYAPACQSSELVDAVAASRARIVHEVRRAESNDIVYRILLGDAPDGSARGRAYELTEIEGGVPPFVQLNLPREPTL